MLSLDPMRLKAFNRFLLFSALTFMGTRCFANNVDAKPKGRLEAMQLFVASSFTEAGEGIAAVPFSISDNVFSIKVPVCPRAKFSRAHSFLPFKAGSKAAYIYLSCISGSSPAVLYLKICQLLI